MNTFLEVNESLDRKLFANRLYLIEENRLSEADIYLYSYLFIINKFKNQFDNVWSKLDKFQNLKSFFENMNVKYFDLLNERLNLN